LPENLSIQPVGDISNAVIKSIKRELLNEGSSSRRYIRLTVGWASSGARDQATGPDGSTEVAISD
jgi:hypothetical protein